MEKLNKEIMHALWRQGIISWLLWPQQMVIYHAIRNLPPSAVMAVILCARQFGKTFLGTLLAIEDCLRYQDKSVLVVGPTIKQTKEIIAPKIREISKTAPPGLIKQSKSEGKWYIGSCDLIIGGFDQKITSDRGKSLQQVYVEEIVDSHPDKYTEAIRSDIGPTLTHSVGGRINFLTTLPKVPDHPFIVDTIPQAKLSKSFYSYDINDNKALTPEQYQRCVDLAGGENSVDFLREYMNQIIRDTSLVVLPNFSEKINVADIPIPHKAYWQTTIDFGGVRDKTSVGLSFYHYLLDVDYFVDELTFDPNTSTDIILPKVLEMEKKWGIRMVEPGIDPSLSIHGRWMKHRIIDCPGQTLVDLQSKRFIAAPPLKTNWKGNINNLDNSFLNKKTLIHPRCQFLITSANSGTLNKPKTDFERTEALGHCDGIAMMMYAIRSSIKENPEGASRIIQSFTQMPKPEQRSEHGLKELAHALTG